MNRTPAPAALTCAAAAAVVSLIACIVVAGALATFFAPSAPATPVASSATLELAYTPEKEALIQDLVNRFNNGGYRTPSGQPMRVIGTRIEAADMVEAARGGRFQAISPDSSLWLTQLDAGRDQPLVGETVRFAVTPIVIAMWSDVAQALGYPGKAIGWQDVLARAQRDSNFKWSHPSTSTASGLLTTLAMFYAGTGKTRGLTEQDVKAKTTLDYVASLEKTVRYYGEGEQATIDQVLAKGRSYIDAFVVSERLVLYFNGKSSSKLVAIYPAEGTLWQDHPLALLEQPGLTDNQRLAFRRLRELATGQEFQKAVLQAGYRPVDLGLKLDAPGSPISKQNGADPQQPQTTLQIPNAAVVELVQSSWYLAKRPANIYLVVDTSGSMATDKLAQAQDAVSSFLDQIQGDRDRVGLVPFSTQVYSTLPLQDISAGRTTLKNAVGGLRASGQTALLDAVSFAYDDLQRRNEGDRINAIVAMTDGIENASHLNLSQLTDKVRRGSQTGVPVLIFCIAYGGDADLRTLTGLADASGGFARRADPDTISRLYRILSTYF